MKVVHALLLGFGAMVAAAASSGAYTLARIQKMSGAVERDVQMHMVASDYARGASMVRMSAQMRALGSGGSEILRREGERMMQSARKRLETQTDASVKNQLREMSRVERLTNDATKSLFDDTTEASKIDPRVLQRLNFVEARAEALSIGLDTFSDKRREHVEETLTSLQGLQKLILAVIAASLAFVLAVALVLSRRLSIPITKLSQGVRELGTGNFDHRIELKSKDELGELAGAFNTMSSNLRDMMQRIEQRNHDMALVLDNVSEGLVVVDPNGVMAGESSRVLSTWFGQAQPGQTLWDYLTPANEHTALCIQVGYEMLLEDLLPREVSLEQMPRRLTRGQQTWELGYRLLLEGERIANVLVVFEDVTARLRAEQTEAEQGAFVAMVEQIMKDRGSALSFVGEAAKLVDSITSGDLSRVALARALHTLKGNCGLFGLKPFAALCHELEDKLAADSTDTLEQPDRQRLRDAWAHWTTRLAVFLNDGRNVIDIDYSEYDQMLVAVIKNVPYAKLAQMLARLRLESAQKRLSHLGNQAAALAVRLEKGTLDVSVEDGDVRVPAETWQPFWSSLVHVVRNAVDHGFQNRDGRAATGKSKPRLMLRTRYDAGAILVEITDNGRGIDWQRIAAKAKEKGLPCSNTEELTQALFADGLSTRDEVTETSGRGLGLASTRAECELLGGKIEVESTLGQGTVFRFRMPHPRLEEVEPRLRASQYARLAS